MFSSRAKTPKEYLAELPERRRDALAAVRRVVVRSLPKGYREMVDYGMLSYCIPLADYPDTYNGRPLCYVALGSHKDYCSLYIMTAYGDPKERAWLAAAFENAGKKLDMGKSCVHFKKADDLPLDAIAELIARTTPAAFIARYEKSRATSAKRAAKVSRPTRRRPARGAQRT